MRLFSLPAVTATLAALAFPTGAPQPHTPPADVHPFTLLGPPMFPTESVDASGIAWADVDGDGDDDAYVAVMGGPNRLFRNEGGGRFTSVQVGELVNVRHYHYGVSFGDYNNDGNVDLFQANGQYSMGSLMYRSLGKGDFRRSDAWHAPSEVVLGWAAAWGDYDNDGFLDLVVTHPIGFVGSPGTGNWLFHNNGDLTFSRVDNSPVVAGFAPYTVPVWVDFDDDGDQDLFIGSGPANGTVAPDYLFRNMLKETGKAVFERITDLPMAKDSLDGQVWNFIDVDGDGDLDGFVTNYVGVSGRGMRNYLYRNNGGTWVRDTTAGPLVTDADGSLGQVWGDFDNDGDLDVFITNGPTRLNRLYWNNGDGTFVRDTVSLPASVPGPSWGASAADIDDDGDLDLMVTYRGPKGGVPVRLFRNDLAAGRHWLELRLVGQKSNRLGIGARVRVYARIGGRSRVLIRDVLAGNTFCGHNSFRVHVGLADATVADSIRIDWPSGQRDLFRGVRSDRYLAATEGKADLQPGRP
jgi:enediyne biosynthesis protein E4